jgi:hypothetical protein
MLYPGSDLSKKEGDRLETQRATKTLVFLELVVCTMHLKKLMSQVEKNHKYHTTCIKGGSNRAALDEFVNIFKRQGQFCWRRGSIERGHRFFMLSFPLFSLTLSLPSVFWVKSACSN